ncbi:OmpW family outer membrane protein [uncultured Roseovarius sp.]|uniref:OmpW/AlkL family protein n=1 Tax=uncultured Roseovarius sp. TaxID=293344 RepID=UPI00261728CE|nr:OmpW family outer membrane protein [uncultured Roseovarius sp.]
MNIRKVLAVLAVVAGCASSVQAGDKGWYVQAGPAAITFDESTNLTAAGTPVPGSNVKVSSEAAFGIGLGYFFNPNFSVIGIAGSTPTSSITGRGAINGLQVGSAQYGPILVMGNYHFRQFGKFQPFIGAGLSYAIIFDQHDGLVQNLKVDDAFGGVIRAGFDYTFDDHHGVFFSMNKIFADTTLTGTVAPGVPGFGGAPVRAKVDLDPLIFHAGYTYRW